MFGYGTKSKKNESDADRLKTALLNRLGLSPYDVSFNPSDSLYLSSSQTISFDDMMTFSDCSAFTDGYYDKEKSSIKKIIVIWRKAFKFLF